MLKGIDVSQWQGLIDWNKVVQSGYMFVFIKASEGIDYRDERTRQNWEAAKSAGLHVGLYHYYVSGDDPLEQAQNFLSVATLVKRGRGDLPPVLDIEDPVRNTQPEGDLLCRNIQTWIETVENALGVSPIVYVSPYFWNEYLKSCTLGTCPLWIAHYGVVKPVLPNEWTAWTFWQYSNRGVVPGISGKVDLDLFNGDEEQLWKIAGLLSDENPSS